MTTIVNAAKRYPMMSPYQIVVVREAQMIKDWDALQYYLQKPLSSTILVFAYKYGTPDKRKKWACVIYRKNRCGVRVGETARLRNGRMDKPLCEIEECNGRRKGHSDAY